MTLSTLPITPIDEYTTTDLGNARRFADQHGWYVRYSHVWKKWLIYDGERWTEDDTGKVFRIRSEARVRETTRLVEAVVRMSGTRAMVIYWREYTP